MFDIHTDWISLFIWVTFSFLSSLRTFIELKMLFWNKFVSNAPLSQSVERDTNKGKVVCSRLTRIRFHLLHGFILSRFK